MEYTKLNYIVNIDENIICDKDSYKINCNILF